jgi:hypothetical protein
MSLAAAMLLAGAMSPAAAQDIHGLSGPRRRDGALVARVPHATTDLTHSHRFSITVLRVVRTSTECVYTERDLVIVEARLENLSRRPFLGRVEHFVLVSQAGAELAGSDAIEPVCGLGDPTTSYFGDLDPPIPPRGRRTIRMLFAVPRGATLLRLDYHHDDFPARFALPRIEVRGP